MVFLVLVVWSATQAGIWLSLYIALLCALSFDYFFLPPFRHLAAGGRAGVGGDDLVPGQLRGGEPGGGAGAPPDPAGRAAAGGCGAALRTEPGDDAARGRRRADPRPAAADRPHLCAGWRGALRLRPGPVLRFDRRSADEHPGQSAGHDAGPESHAGSCRATSRPCR